MSLLQSIKRAALGDRSLAFLLAALGTTILCTTVAILFVLSPPGVFLFYAVVLILWLLLRDPFWGVALLFITVAFGSLGNLTDTGSITVLKILTVVVGLVWVSKALIRQEIEGVIATLSNPINVLLGVLCLLMLLSVLNAYDVKQATVSFLRIMACVGLCFLIQFIVRSERQVRVLVKVIIFFGFLLSVGGIYEHMTHKSVQTFFGKKHYLSVGAQSGHLISTYHAGAISPTAKTSKGAWARVQTTFGDPNFFGSYLVSLIAFVMGSLLGSRQRSGKWCYALILALALFSLWATGSRGSLTAFMGMLLFYFLAVPMRFKGPAFIIVLVLCALLAVGVSQMPQFRAGFSISAAKGNPRTMLWIMASKMIRDHPILGVGVGNFMSVYAHYRIPTASESPQITHSTILEIWSEMGTLAAVVALGYILLNMAQLWITSRRLVDPRRFHLVVGLMGAVFGYSLCSLTLSLLDDQVYWCLLALSIAGCEALRRAEGLPHVFPVFGPEATGC